MSTATDQKQLEKYPGFGPELFVQLPAPGIQEEWDRLYQWWRDNFVFGLPQEVQDKMSWFFPGGEATRADHGFIRRGQPGDDQKWFIHVRPYDQQQRQLPLLFEEIKGSLPDDPWYDNFLDWYRDVVTVFEKVFDTVKKFAIENFSPEYHILDLLNHPVAMQKHVVRMLHYDPQPIGKYLASLHKDFDLITADCLTTQSGLCLSHDESAMCEKQMVSEKSGHIILFPGRKMHEVTNGKIPGLCHGVLSSKSTPRGAVVCFFHGPGPMGPSCPS